MKIGERDVWLRAGQWWICNTFLGREWISPDVAGGGRPGFWLRDVPRRMYIRTPFGALNLAWTPGSRWGEYHRDPVTNKLVLDRWRWIEWGRTTKG